MLWSVWWAWIGGAIALVILEILAPGYIFLGFAIGATAGWRIAGLGRQPEPAHPAGDLRRSVAGVLVGSAYGLWCAQRADQDMGH